MTPTESQWQHVRLYRALGDAHERLCGCDQPGRSDLCVAGPEFSVLLHPVIDTELSLVAAMIHQAETPSEYQRVADYVTALASNRESAAE